MRAAGAGNPRQIPNPQPTLPHRLNFARIRAHAAPYIREQMANAPSEPGSWPRRAWRAARNVAWWVPLSLALVLGVDACSRPNDPPFASSSFGLWLKGPAPIRGARHPSTYPLVIVRGPDGVDRFDDRASADEPIGGEIVCDGRLLGARVGYSGAWGMTTRETHAYPGEEMLSHPEADRRRWGQLLDEFLASMGAAPDHPSRLAAQMFRDGIDSRTETVPAGYIHNAIAVALAITFLWTATLGRPWRSWSVWRRARLRDYWLSRGQCPHCRYDVHGYPGTVCPECGLDWGDEPRAR